jgi:hypothetical protein
VFCTCVAVAGQQGTVYTLEDLLMNGCQQTRYDAAIYSAHCAATVKTEVKTSRLCASGPRLHDVFEIDTVLHSLNDFHSNTVTFPMKYSEF